jgi:hypothetical protein
MPRSHFSFLLPILFTSVVSFLTLAWVVLRTLVAVVLPVSLITVVLLVSMVATLDTMATARAGDTATGEVMATMGTAMTKVPMPMTAAPTPTATADTGAFWFATKTE